MNLRKLPFFLMMFICICWVAIVILKTQTSLKTILCQGCTEDATLALAELKDKSLFSIGQTTLDEILVPHDLSLVSYKKQLPHQLEIAAAPNPPIYAIYNSQNNKTWKVTQAGLKVETTDTGELPLFTIEQDISHTYLTELLPFFSFMPTRQPISILTKNWAELTPKQEVTLIFNPTQPLQQKEIITYLLANWPQTLPKDIKEVDVRFRLPVARSTRTKPSDVWTQQEKSATVSTEITTPTASSAAGL